MPVGKPTRPKPGRDLGASGAGQVPGGAFPSFERVTTPKPRRQRCTESSSCPKPRHAMCAGSSSRPKPGHQQCTENSSGPKPRRAVCAGSSSRPKPRRQQCTGSSSRPKLRRGQCTGSSSRPKPRRQQCTGSSRRPKPARQRGEREKKTHWHSHLAVRCAYYATAPSAWRAGPEGRRLACPRRSLATGQLRHR